MSVDIGGRLRFVRDRHKLSQRELATYLMSEWLSTFCPSVLVADAQAIQNYYLERYGKRSTFIAYGAEVGRVTGTEVLHRLGVESGRYFLYVTRMEPENHPLEVREAFEKVVTALRLVLVGDAPYSQEYIRRVRDTSDPRVVLPGAIYGTGYHELQSHCFAYIHATEVGGTHPALIEAMGRGALVLYRDTPENAEVAGDAGMPFGPENLTAQIRRVLEMSDAERDRYRRRAMERVRQKYSWDAVTEEYERLFQRLLG